MAYRFKLDETFEKGFRRVAREQIDRALSELSPLEVGPTGVHESRKALKRLRALLRLMAPAIGRKAFDERNAALRKAARLLSARRDEAVMTDTIRQLETSADSETLAALAAVRARLAQAGLQSARPLDSETAQRARVLLVKESKRLAKTSLKSRGLDAMLAGLEDSYRAGRKALKKAYAKPSDEALHDLRKAVQWHWRHMALISRAWPDAFAARVAAARELSQLLGDDHDLAVLAGATSSLEGLPPASVAAVQRACRTAQTALREAAEYRAERLFAERPRSFSARCGAYWTTGRHIAPLADKTASPQKSAGPTALTPIDGDQPASVQVAAITPAQQASQRRA